jgi:hypothetical protein
MIKLNLVDNIDLVINKGDAREVFNTELGWTQLIICCPGCGKVSGSACKHKYNKETQSYTPSIVHDIDLGGCGWHGFLTNGEFIEVK